MSTEARPVAHETKTLFISFIDITSFSRAARELAPIALAELANDSYIMFDEAAVSSGGTVVKFLGDGALITWPEASADAAVSALLKLYSRFAEAMQSRGLALSLLIKGHVGPVVAGPFGAPGREKYDICGSAAIIAARLQTKTFSLSGDAFRSLSPDMRTRFKKHTEPVVYIPADHPRP